MQARNSETENVVYVFNFVNSNTALFRTLNWRYSSETITLKATLCVLAR